MDRAESLRMVAGEEVGRIAVVVGGAPHVVPVNYVVDGDAIVFRTAAGTKLAGAASGPIAFEVDSFDRASRSGWSVVVHGRAEEVLATDAQEVVQRLDALPLSPWSTHDKPHLVRVVAGVVTGRRLGTS
jgi:nitroimidazol reductase NimA-like FMN-containing flavoprotein (pyridoxamine 5'-phosphate oxidase superfamily)